MKIIFFELNEVPARIVDYYCALLPNSNLAKLSGRARRFNTFAEDLQENLSPWVTWPTVYRGVANDKHGINHLGQPLAEIDAEYPPLWDILSRNRIRTGIFGTLHSYPMPADLNGYAFYIPDTFAAGSECFPETLAAFQEFNLTMVSQSGRNVSGSVPWAPALTFLSKLSELGIKPKTLAGGAAQMISEKVNSARKSRRRVYQAVLAFDIFMKQLRREKPDFCTFFTNHVASSMHRFWAALFPQDYSEFRYDAEWVSTYDREIVFAMSKFDQMLGSLVSFADANPDYALWIATSMGQAATTTEPVKIEGVLNDVPKFMRALGVPEGQWERRPAMMPQVSIKISDDYRAAVERDLSQIVINDAPLKWQRTGDFFSITCLCTGFRSVVFRGNLIEPATLGMEDIEIEELSGCNAYHIPQGCMFIYSARQNLSQTVTEISTRDIAPSILRNFGIAPPAYMNQKVLIHAA